MPTVIRRAFWHEDGTIENSLEELAARVRAAQPAIQNYWAVTSPERQFVWPLLQTMLGTNLARQCIFGLKLGNVLTDIDDLDGWDAVVADIEATRTAFAALGWPFEEMVLENEWLMYDYWRYVRTPNMEGFGEGLSRLPRDLRYIYWTAGGPEDSLPFSHTLWETLLANLPAGSRLCNHGPSVTPEFTEGEATYDADFMTHVTDFQETVWLCTEAHPDWWASTEYLTAENLVRPSGDGVRYVALNNVTVPYLQDINQLLTPATPPARPVATAVRVPVPKPRFVSSAQTRHRGRGLIQPESRNVRLGRKGKGR